MTFGVVGRNPFDSHDCFRRQFFRGVKSSAVGCQVMLTGQASLFEGISNLSRRFFTNDLQLLLLHSLLVREVSAKTLQNRRGFREAASFQQHADNFQPADGTGLKSLGEGQRGDKILRGQ